MPSVTSTSVPQPSGWAELASRSVRRRQLLHAHAAAASHWEAWPLSELPPLRSEQSKRLHFSSCARKAWDAVADLPSSSPGWITVWPPRPSESVA